MLFGFCGRKVPGWLFAVLLVLRQGYKLGFSVPVVFRGKAQCASKGCSLVKHCNAAAEHHRGARRVGLSASMAALMEYIPVFHPFGVASRSQSPPGGWVLLLLAKGNGHSLRGAPCPES